jgi:DNA-directed RNA polymerase specialized sigma24 family protein
VSPRPPSTSADLHDPRSERFTIAERIIGRLAARYTRVLHRGPDFAADLAQAAWEELLRNEHRWAPARGPWEGFVLTVVARRVRRESVRLRVPVSGDTFRTAWAAAVSGVADDVLAAVPADDSRAPTSPHTVAVGAQFWRLLRGALRHVPHADHALRVVLLGESAAVVAARAGVDLYALRTSARRVRHTADEIVEFVKTEDGV